MAADDGAGTETDPAARLGVVPVAERYARGGGVDVAVEGFHELDEGAVVLGHGGSPHNPVALRVVGAAVEGQTVGVLATAVVACLGGHGIVGEKICAPHLVPHHVVLLAPGACTVVSKAVMVAVAGVGFPLGGHISGCLQVGGSQLLVATLAEDFGEASHTHNGLDGEVAVVCPMAGEIVGAELLSRILAVLDEVVGPALADAIVAFQPVAVALHAADGGGEGEHIAALLEGHVTAIDLSIGMGVGSQVVGSKLLAPLAAEAIFEDAGHHGLLELIIVDEEERCGGVGEVDGVDAAVGVVFLREEEKSSAVVLEEFMGSDNLTV